MKKHIKVILFTLIVFPITSFTVNTKNATKGNSVISKAVVFKPQKLLDAYGYSHSAIAYSFTDISGTGTDTGITADDGETTVTMPFEFDLYGTVSRTLRIGANGAILFDAATGDIPYTNETFPNASYPLMIAPYWDDLVPSNGEIYYETQGTAPNRVFIVQWEAVDAYPTGFGSGTFQVKLYEGTNNIDFVYEDTDFNGFNNDEGESATIGINQDGSDAELNTFNSDDNSAQSGDAIRFTHPDNAVAMSFTSSTTSQVYSGIGVATGATNQRVIRIEVVVDGNSSPLNVTNFDFNTTGTTDASNDIQNGRVYYTGTSPDFDTSVQFGSDVASPNGSFSVSSTQSIVNGTNYFWLSYDIQGSATDGNFIDAECTSVTVGSSQTPTVTAPSGNREIGAPAGLSCSDAFIITPVCGGTATVNATTTGGDASNYGTCNTASNTVEKAWHVLAGDGSTVTVVTNDIGSILNDTKIWVYSGACGSLTCVDGNDDTSGLYSSVTFATTYGTDYYILVGGYGADDVGDYELEFTFENSMTYTSSTTTQNTSATSQSATDVQIIGVEVVTTDACDPLDVTSITFNTTGSSDAANDIDNAKVYYTGTSSTFATSTQVGSTEVSPDGTFTINGFTQALSEGTNYFWLAYDIAAGATDLNVVDAQCTSITVDGIPRTPTVISPSGNRIINPDISVLRGNQLSFDGNDYCEAVGYTGISGSNDRTIELWTKSSANSLDVFLDYGNLADNERWAFGMNTNGTLFIYDGSNFISSATSGNFIAVDDDTWHHVAVVLNGTTFNDVDFYVDGILQNKGTNFSTVNTGTSNNVFIGTTVAITNDYVGEMEEVRIWDDARTQDEIRENMHITLTGTEPNLVGYWQFNEDSGTTFSDLTGNHDLTRGDGSTSSTYPTIETSTVAVAGGSSNLQTVNSTGAVTFTGTNISMNFTVAPVSSSEFVVYKLTGQAPPGNDPLSDIPTLNVVSYVPYWVVRTFGASGYTTDLTFDLANNGKAVSADDEATPSNLKLVSRSSNSYGAWSSVSDAISASENTGNVTFSGITTFSQVMVGTTNNSPLPITLRSFEGYTENDEHHLVWVTSSEINNERFELEVSLDGVNFVKIAEISGAGTIDEEREYEYVVKNPKQGKNYYRLKQIDFDGHFEYVGGLVLLENIDSNNSLDYLIIPNPSDNTNVNLQIQTTDYERDIEINVYDLFGRLLYNKTIKPDQISGLYSVQFGNKLRSGIYLVVLNQGGNKMESRLLVK